MTELARWLGPLLDALDHAGVGLLVLRDGAAGVVVVYANRTVQAIYGRSTAELQTLDIITLVAPEEQPKLEAMRAAILRGDPAPPFEETIVIRPDGSRVPIELGLATARDGDDVIALTSIRDVSDRRALQAQLLEADRLATVGALSAGLAHEINNPLTSVLLQLGGLRRSPERWARDDAHAHVVHVLDTVIAAAERIGGAVRAMTVFADPALGRKGPVDVRAVVEGAVRSATPVLESRARLELDLGAVPMVDADPPRLGQAVLNLLLDASCAFDDADRDRNLISVQVRDEPPWVVVEVTDNGRAIVRTEGAFEPFFPSRGETSTGIGLAVTRTVVASLGGTVSLARRDGGGAVATIRLPARAR
jgi:two-component system, NtrC family, sensor kinase